MLIKRWEFAKFNDRMQVTELGLGNSATDAGVWKTNYEYGELQTNGTVDTTKNTGNIAKQILTVPGTSFVESYKYDSLYRITEAKETTGATQNWIQNWAYDRYGNRTGFTQNIGGITNAPNPTIDANTNRFTDLVSFAYDKNGNVIKDVDAVTSQSRTFVFNGDNKQTQVKDANNNVIGNYFYDGEGKRVKKITDTETTVFVYSAGKLIAEYSTNIAPFEDAKVAYTTTDHLGTPRVITNQFGVVVSRRDFLPFGEEINTGVGARSTTLDYGSTEDNVRQKFTGYQKDNETSLDFAEARMYENRFGRFTAVDPLLASGRSANPQTFNRFIYVMNNPIINTDPSGLCVPGQCPSSHIGLVYYKTDANGKTWYNNEQLDDTWSVFSGRVTLTDGTDNYRYTIYGDGTFSGSGWRRINEATQALLGGFNEGLSDVQSGSWTGVRNVPSTAWNSAVTATVLPFALPFSSTYTDGYGLPGLKVPIPFLVEGYEYDNERQARWGQQVTTGILAAPAVFGIPFRSTSGVSVAPQTVSNSGGLNLHSWKSPQATTATGWKTGDYFLYLENKGSPKANWAQNSGALRREMNSSRPIFDS